MSENTKTSYILGVGYTLGAHCKLAIALSVKLFCLFKFCLSSSIAVGINQEAMIQSLIFWLKRNLLKQCTLLIFRLVGHVSIIQNSNCER
jgi:hypothetical protein